ncbi:MAG: hypothetical protein FE78DRAFT_70810 [Acidomyces sp. 'richmondensis']|nr:MAG: hypothetical protein FE78DRAFT_70810 [Acidomyces sp. 'richmondensis']
MPPQGQRRGPPPGYGPQLRQAPIRPAHPGAGTSDGRLHKPQAYPQTPPSPPPPPPVDSTENLYDGSAYGEPEYQGDQWPLPARPVAAQHRNGSPQNSSPRRPPQRPQRPDFHSPSLDPRSSAGPSPVSRQTPPPPPPPPPPPAAHHGPGQWNGEGYTSPSQYDPSMQLLYQQGIYGQANKRPPLGPPPSARRGPASYYPRIAPVHPIAEETESMRGSIRNGSVAGRDSTRSYASSNAIPIGIPDYYLEHRDSAPSLPGADRPISGPDSEYSDSPIEQPPPLNIDHSRGDGSIDSVDWRDANPEPPALIRQASLGKKSRPTLTTVKSGERMRKTSSGEGISSLPSQQRDSPGTKTSDPSIVKEADLSSDEDSDDESMARIHDKVLEAGAAAAVAALATKKSEKPRDTPSRASEVLSSGTGLLDPSSSESEKSMKKKKSKDILGIPVPKMGKSGQPRPRSKSPLASEVEVDPPLSDILGGLEKGGALPPRETEQLKVPTGGLSERAGKPRPPRLNVDAVREAEARGSLTSLPDLIKRATRLASNLDRGKTASRLGMNWFDGADTEPEKSDSGNGRHSGLSDMLASFPPPGLATPTGSRVDIRSSLTNWPSHLQHSHLPSDSDGGEARARKRKRCCGMPLWLFLLLLVIVILLVAAAIIVPVVLIVVPRQEHNSDSQALTQCQSKLTCQNGGANVITNGGKCQCICVNGFTGTTCSTSSSAGCTTTTVGSTSDATVGDAIPRLLSAGETNFSIPLDGQTLLGLFSGADLSCSSENALVTFNNNAARRRTIEELEATPIPTATVERRNAASTNDAGAATSNGIVYETGSPTTSATASSSASTTASPQSNSTTLDFARVAVLYIFEASGNINDAINAQEYLQSYFTSGTISPGQTSSSANVSLGSGFSCDLSTYRIDLGNGTTVGR